MSCSGDKHSYREVVCWSRSRVLNNDLGAEGCCVLARRVQVKMEVVNTGWGRRGEALHMNRFECGEASRLAERSFEDPLCWVLVS